MYEYIMNEIQITNELELMRLKIKLSSTLKYYVLNSNHQEMNLFYRVLELLKQKYVNDANVYNFLEQGIRCNLQNNNNRMNNISYISSYISNCSNVSVMNELLNCIDTGVSYVRQENIERLLIENQIITLEQNNSLERIEENTRT